MKYVYTFVFILISVLLASAQCDCDNCPVPIISNNTTTATVTIAGAVNDQLGMNGQKLCQVCVHFVHDAPDEIDFFLISPSGSQVQLIENTGLSVNDNITFDICFLSCDQTAMPDPGFPAVFDSGAGWQPNQTYTGTYYPFDPACLESLTGDVNGTWTLEMTDNVGLDDGTLFEVYLVFEDDTGIGCANAGDCNPSCVADAGTVTVPPDTSCVGDPGLNMGFTPFYDGSTHIEPPAADYGYAFIVSETGANQPVLQIAETPDLTSFGPGTYAICGFSYLLADSLMIPTPDGSLTSEDIQALIDNDDICADIMDICWIRTIEDVPPLPDFTGPLQVCEGDPVEYVVNNFDPLITLNIQLLQGTVDAFSQVEDTVFVTWSSGPGTICAEYETSCGTEQTCLIVDVVSDPAPSITGNFDVCGGAVETYTVTPSPSPPASYVYDITGGMILGQTDNTVTIEWSETDFNGQICVQLTGGSCVGEQVCEAVTIDNFVVLPPSISVPVDICFGETATASIPFNPGILSYDWTATGLTVLSGQGTNSITFEGVAPGAAILCVEVSTDCGIQGPLCADVFVTATPAPVIDPVPASCDLTIPVNAVLSGAGGGTWMQITGPPGVVFVDASSATTSATFPQSGIYVIRFTETDGPCEGFDEITVEILPDLELSAPVFDCNIDQEYTVTFEILSGQEPFSVNGTSIGGNIFTSEPLPSGQPYSFLVEDALGCVAELQGSFECPCLSDAGTMPGQIVEVCAATGDNVVVNANGDAFLDGNDIGVYILHDGSGSTLGTIFDENASGIFAFGGNLMYGVTYYVSFVVGNDLGGFVDVNDPCLSVSFGQPVIFYDLPTADLNLDGDACDLTFQLNGTLSGGVISTIWSQVSGPGMSTFDTPFSVPATVSVNQPGSYTYQLEIANAACTAFEEIAVDVNFPPEIILPEETCDGTATSYVLTFEVVGGTAPYEATVSGSFNGSLFTSDPIPSGEGYSVIVTDANGCMTNELIGGKSCDCITDAGTMSSDLIEVCGTLDSARATATGDTVLDGDDQALYYLHTSSTNALGTILDRNDSGVFGFLPGMQTDITYYISLVVGNMNATGIDLTDPCLDVAQGQPVIWYSLPAVEAGDPDTVCVDTVSLAAEPDIGIWEVVSAPSGANPQLSSLSDPQAILTVDAEGNYSLLWTGSNGICSVTDSVVITKAGSPEIVNIQTSCSDDLMTYQLTFEITGETGPYLVNGSPSPETYTSSMLPVDSIAEFVIVGASGCPVTITSGPVNCDCLTDPGTISGQDQALCTDEALDVLISSGDAQPDDNDTLAYILHDGTATQIGNVLEISFGDPIAYAGGFQTGQTYVLSVVVANARGDSVDLSDPCLGIAGSIEVMWNPVTTVTVNDTIMACAGEDVNIAPQVDGLFPVTVTLVGNQQDTSVQMLEDADAVISLPVPDDATIEWSLTEVAGVCTRNGGGMIRITGVAPRNVSLASMTQLCNTPEFGASVLLTDLFISTPVPGEWMAPGLIITGDTLIASGVDTGTYILSFDTRGFEDPCPGSLYEVEVRVVECTCPPIEIPAVIERCNGDSLIDLETLNPDGLVGNWSLGNPEGLSNPPVVSNTTLDILGKTAGSYTLIFTVTDTLPDGCENSAVSELMLIQQLRTGIQSEVPQFCADDTAAFSLFNALEEFDTGGFWLMGNTIVDPDIIPAQLDTGTLIFSYNHPESGECPKGETVVEIVVVPAPAIEISVQDIVCLGDHNGRIAVLIEDQDDGPFEFFLNSIPQSNLVADSLAAGVYDVRVVNRFGCDGRSDGILLEQPEVFSVTLGEDLQVQAGETVQLEAVVSKPSDEIVSYEWSNASGPIDMQGNVLTREFISDETIQVVVTDNLGCTAFAQVQVRVVVGNVYIPNVINPQSGNPANRQFGLFAGQGIERIERIVIFDRWGNTVYSQTDISPGNPAAFWDGTFDGELVLPGVYVYVIEFRVSGRTDTLTGDVTVVR